MMSILSFLRIIFIILIILVILTQSVSVKILKKKNFLLEFNFTFFAFSIDPGKKERKKKKKKNPLLERIRTYSLVVKTLRLALSHSHLKIKAFNVPSSKGKEITFLALALLNIPRDTLLAYLDSISASFEYTPHESDDAEIDAIIQISFYHLIVTLVYYFKERLKSNYKARIRS